MPVECSGNKFTSIIGCDCFKPERTVMHNSDSFAADHMQTDGGFSQGQAWETTVDRPTSKKTLAARCMQVKSARLGQWGSEKGKWARLQAFRHEKLTMTHVFLVSTVSVASDICNNGRDKPLLITG